MVGIQSGGDEDFTETDNGNVVVVQGGYYGGNSNLNRDLIGEHGSFIPQKVIDLIEE